MSAPNHDHDPDSDSDKVTRLQAHSSLLFLLLIGTIAVMFGAMFLIYNLAPGS
ncbi:hypothetical protein SAMN05661080_01169 [Modestobacter sp. DSM 44400]|uniref:hypothetical protein n=1 Tax=Modestobacter sp. DSM 44400 TaxID=1550230 RepID=UPI00089CD905|nr:hypothetical protein [Modestobacter sp. DSM 44400]SDX78336.1 hypothetical protein SAMN05661080_01169 [Modestobacter sp. DSM 44400]